MELTVGEVWVIPGGTLPNWKQNVFFALASDRVHWDAGHSGVYFICGERWPGEGKLNINEKTDMFKWEDVRLYAIKHLIPKLKPPQPIPKFYRFKNLDLK